MRGEEELLKTEKEEDHLGSLLEILPGRVRAQVEKHPEKSEVSLLLGRPLVLSTGGWEPPLVFPEIVIREDEIDFVVAKLSGIKADGRAGIDGTAHRISVIYDRYRQIIGLTVRIARWVKTLDQELAGHILEGRGSVLIIGPPGSGKTTLLRGLVALLAGEVGPHLSVIDTSNEIGGLGRVPHPALGVARWHQVPHPKDQAEIIRRTIANHAPLVLVLDEVGYNEDVEEVEAAARRGIQVISSVHGKDLLDVLENPVYAPFLGYPDRRTGRRRARPSFRMAVEVRKRDKILLHPNLAQAVDRMLMGLPPEGIRIGPGWFEGEEPYSKGEIANPPLVEVARAYTRRDPRLAGAASSRGLDERGLLRLMARALSGEEEALETIEELAREVHA